MVAKKGYLCPHRQGMHLAETHYALSVQEFLAAKNIAVIQYPPYMSHLGAAFFSNKSLDLRQYFDMIGNIQKAVTDQLTSLTGVHHFQEWKKRLLNWRGRNVFRAMRL